jgi:hypothetical protein
MRLRLASAVTLSSRGQDEDDRTQDLYDLRTSIWGWIVAFLMLLTFLTIGTYIAAAGEDICFDRSPWWGPPEDPTSTCAGHWYEARHHAPFPQR